MGRGRAKAKQTKVARELKYHTQDTDFSALQRELGGSSEPSYRATESDREPYSDDDDEDDGPTWATGSR
jgi:Protein of unknown function (DUF3073)